MQSDSEAHDPTTFGPLRLVISTLVLVAALGAGWIWLYGVPDALVATGRDADAATPAQSDSSGNGGGSSLEAPPAMPVPVRTAIAERADLVKTITATGNAEALRSLVVTAATQGVIAEIAVEEGDVVEAGALLARLDDADLQLAVERNRESLVRAVGRYQANQVFIDVDDATESAFSELREAESELLAGSRSPDQFRALIDDPRFDALFETITRDEVVAAQDGLLASYATYKESVLQLERARVVAPFGGQVATLEAVVGARVSPGAELLTLIDADPIRVRVDVLESEAGLVRRGREARVHFAAYPTDTFVGRIETISPVMDPDRKTLEVIVTLPNRDLRLKPGMFARIALDTEIFPDRLLVPAAAVLLRDERPMLFVVRDGRSDWIYIRKGLENTEMVEVLEGVEPGDEVIVSGHYSLAHDAPVRVVEDDEAVPGEAP